MSVDWLNYYAAKRMADFHLNWMREQYTVTDVKGYTPLSDDKKELANTCKELEERMMRYLDSLRGRPEVDQRCLALAVTNLQQGCMWAVRSIFQPTRVTLPEDTKPQSTASES